MGPSKTIDTKILSSTFEQFDYILKSARIQKLAGDASSREYFRISSPQQNLVLQVSEIFKSSAEHPFLIARELFEKAGLPVPTLLGSAPEKGWILLEDLGDEALQKHPSLDFYREALDLLIRLASEASPQSQKIGRDLGSRAPHFKWAFDLEKLQAEMAFTEEHLIKKFLKRDEISFTQLLEGNSKYLAESPRVFCHRDFHSRNLMIHNEKIFVIDFQDARMGPLSYDLVSLVWDPYVKLSDAWKKSLMEHWERVSAPIVKKLTAQKPGHNFEVERERMKVQRLLKAAGSYASFFNNKGRKDYLPHILPALKDSREALVTLQNLNAATRSDAELLTLISSIESGLSDIIKDT